MAEGDERVPLLYREITRRGWLILLAVVAVIAVVGAVVHHERTRTEDAKMFCTMQPGIPSIYSPEFKNCVEQNR